MALYMKLPAIALLFCERPRAIAPAPVVIWLSLPERIVSASAVTAFPCVYAFAASVMRFTETFAAAAKPPFALPTFSPMEASWLATFVSALSPLSMDFLSFSDFPALRSVPARSPMEDVPEPEAPSCAWRPELPAPFTVLDSIVMPPAADIA